MTPYELSQEKKRAGDSVLLRSNDPTGTVLVTDDQVSGQKTVGRSAQSEQFIGIVVQDGRECLQPAALSHVTGACNILSVSEREFSIC